MTRGNQILAGLVALQAVLLIGMNLGGDDRMVVEQKQLFADLDPKKVTRIEIQGPPDSGQERIVLERSGNSWSIETADAYPAKSEKVEEFLDTVASLRSTTTVVTSDRYHEKLEVAEDAFKRRVELSVDAEPIEFFVGTSPSFKNTHVRVAGSDDVFLVPELAASDVAERAWNWVERAYVDVSADEVWSVDVLNEKGRFRLERDPATDQWAAVGIEDDLDTSVVDNLVRKARSINLESPVGKTTKPEYGLDDPRATVQLVVGTSTIAGAAPPTTETKTIRVGAKLDDESRYYLKADDSDYVVQVAEYAVKPLIEKGPADLVRSEDD